MMMPQDVKRTGPSYRYAVLVSALLEVPSCRCAALCQPVSSKQAMQQRDRYIYAKVAFHMHFSAPSAEFHICRRVAGICKVWTIYALGQDGNSWVYGIDDVAKG